VLDRIGAGEDLEVVLVGWQEARQDPCHTVHCLRLVPRRREVRLGPVAGAEEGELPDAGALRLQHRALGRLVVGEARAQFRRGGPAGTQREDHSIAVIMVCLCKMGARLSRT